MVMFRGIERPDKSVCESVDDPHELLLSLVDMGSLDIEDALLACVKEMSDAECKRVLGSLQLPECDNCDDETPAEAEEPEEVTDDTMEFEIEPVEVSDDADEIEIEDDVELDENATKKCDDCSNEKRLLDRLERLEKLLSK